MLKTLIRRAFCTRYTQTHEYITRLDGKKAVVGISHHAKSELGEIIFVDLNVGTEGDIIEANNEIASLESVKAAASVYAPIGIKLIKKNENALKEINIDSEKKGFLWEVEIINENEFKGLLTLEQYKANL